MRVSLWVLSLAVTAQFGVRDVAAQGYTPPRVGLTVEYRQQETGGMVFGRGTSTFTIVICAVAGDSVAICNQSNGPSRTDQRTFRGIHPYGSVGNDLETHLDGDTAPLRALWPLAIGKSAEVLIRLKIRTLSPEGKGPWQPRSAFKFAYRIDAKEDVAVPAGRFDTWIIVTRDERADPEAAPKPVGLTRVWFAPSLGWYVKFERRGLGGTLVVREAIRISGN